MGQPTKEQIDTRQELYEQGLKLCPRCNEIKPISEYTKNIRMFAGLCMYCKECFNKMNIESKNKHRDKIREAGRAYYQEHKEQNFANTRRYRLNSEFRAKERAYGKSYNATKHGQQVRAFYQDSDARRESSRRWTDNNRDKKQAGWCVWKAKKDGKLIQPANCEKCGIETGKLHAHHYLGYAKEHRLDVQWLCVSCHESMHHNLS